MRRVIAIATIIISLISPSAMAKTEANYLTAHFINTKMQFNNNSGIEDEQKSGFGISYKYAFNFYNFFLAPGVFYDFTNVKTKDQADNAWTLDYRYGAKMDLGYDLTDWLAIYGSAGLAETHYHYDNKNPVDSRWGSGVYGVLGGGVKWAFSKRGALSLEYDISNIAMKDLSEHKNNANVGVTRIGIAFNF